MKPDITQKQRRTALVVLLPTIFLTQLACLAQELPALQQGELYKKERKKIFVAGWQKAIDLSRSCSNLTGFEKDTCFKYQELVSCSVSGYCAFLWRNADGKSIRAITFGDEHALLNLSLEQYKIKTLYGDLSTGAA